MKNCKMVKFFTPEYTKQCVDMVLDGKHSVTQVCKMMRVRSICLESLASAISAEQREIQRLRAENEQLRSDNALLKKVSAFLLEKP